MECLVTRLKGTINDESVYKLGELRLSKSLANEFTQIGQSFRIAFVKDATVSIIGNGYFTDETGSENRGKVIECLANTPYNLYLSNGDYEISLSDKYSIGNLMLSKADYATGSYLYNSTKNIIGDLEALKHSVKMSTFDAGLVFRLQGNLSALRNLPLLRVLNLSQTSVSGDISVLRCPIDRLNVDRCNNITGRIESFVATQRSAGRTTGEISRSGETWGNLTFNGTSIDNGTITWTASQITCGDITVNA